MIAKRRKKKKSIQGIFFLILVIFFVVSITALLLVSNFKIREKRKELLSQIETVKKEIQNLEKKNQEMKAGISESQTQDYLEKEAREKLGLKKAGEEVVAIKKIQTEEKPTEQKEEKSLWQKFLEFLRIK
jgi:cell division protein FtsB